MKNARPEVYVSTHSRLKAAGTENPLGVYRTAVSTHSRLKAAGFFSSEAVSIRSSFNTQPPEGGW